MSEEIQVRCPQCNHHAWIDAGRLDRPLNCEACGSTFPPRKHAVDERTKPLDLAEEPLPSRPASPRPRRPKRREREPREHAHRVRGALGAGFLGALGSVLGVAAAGLLLLAGAIGGCVYLIQHAPNSRTTEEAKGPVVVPAPAPSKGPGAKLAPKPIERPPADDPWAKAAHAGEWLRSGDVMVCVPAGVDVAPVPLRYLGRASSSENAHAILKVQIRNVSADKILNYDGWASDRWIEHKWPQLTDTLGNRYRRTTFGFGTHPAGQLTSSTSIYPDKTADDVLVFQRPVETAGELRLELPGEAVGLPGQVFRFRFAKEIK